MSRPRKQHFAQMINYYRYLNTRTDCFCTPPAIVKKFTSRTNTENISNYQRVGDVLMSPNALSSARVSYTHLNNPAALESFLVTNYLKQFNVPKNRF